MYRVIKHGLININWRVVQRQTVAEKSWQGKVRSLWQNDQTRTLESAQ